MQRIFIASLGAAAVVLVMALAGCGGGTSDGSSPEPTDSTEQFHSVNDVDATSEGACERVSSLAAQLEPMLTLTAEQAALTKSDDIRSASAAISGYATEAPADLQGDIARVSATWGEIAGAIFELGLESGSSPDATQVEATNGRVRDALAEPGFTDSLSKVSVWLRNQVAQCQAAADTKTTESRGAGSTDPTGTGDRTGTVSQDVEQTCEGIVELLTQFKKPADSIEDVQAAAAAFSELAGKAPAETEESFPSGAGDPRDSLQGIADGYAEAASLFSELGLKPGPDALQEPRIADIIDDIQLELTLGVQPWVEARCSADVQEQLQQGG
jgi:hypothetical protein